MTTEQILTKILDKLTDEELEIYIHNKNRFAYKAVMKAKKSMEQL